MADNEDETEEQVTPAVSAPPPPLPKPPLYSDAIPVSPAVSIVPEGRNTLTRVGHVYNRRVLGILRALGKA